MVDSFTFQGPANILFEAGASRKIDGLVANYGARRVMLVTDRGVRGAGLTRDAEAALAAAGIAVTVFEDVVADPPSHVVERAAEACRSNEVELVLSIGGGSALDTAKLVAYLAKTPDRLDDIYGVGLAKGGRLPLLLAPTTAGTGSEVTPIAIVTTPTTEKKGVVSPVLIPDWAILDPELTLGLPPAVTAATGIDAMVHAIEAYTSRHKKNPLSDALAREALRLLGGNLLAACRDGRDRAAREAMLLGAMLAGQAFANAPVAAVHALAYPLGGHYHVPHGLSNALMLGSVLRFNARAAAPLYAELDTVLNGPGAGGAEERALHFVDSMQRLMDGSGAPRRLRDVGVTDNSLAMLAADAMKQTRLLVNNPVEVTEADALALYREAF